MPLHRLIASVFVLAAAAGLTAGCGSISTLLSDRSALGSIQGRALGGQQPVATAALKLYAVGSAGDASAATNLFIGPLFTDANGAFSIPAGYYTCPTASTLVYMAAIGGNPGLALGTNNSALVMLTALGPCGSLGTSTFININEVTTVAAVSALMPFMSSYSNIGSGNGDAANFSAAFTLASEFANFGTGFSPGTGVAAGTAVPAQKINTLADIFASCVNTAGGTSGDGSACGNLFALSGGSATTNVVASALYVAENPTANVSGLFNLAMPTPPFLPALSAAPASWSIVLQTIPTLTWSPPASITYGTALSATQLNATASVAGAIAYTPSSGTVLTAGTQTLSATFTPTDTTNYTGASKTLSQQVNQAVPALSWGAIASINYGTALTSTQLNATSSVPGNFAYNPPAGTVLTAGTQTLNAAFTPTDTTDYINNSLTNTITVNNTGPSYTWNNVQILGGGFVTGIVAHPTQQNLRYARTDVGGAYKWNQSTGAWVRLDDFVSRSNSNMGGCEAIGLDPSDPTRLYLAMGEYAESFGGNGEFLISSDQGTTFTTVAAPFKMGSNDAGRHAGERLAVDPNLGTKMYYGTRLNGLYVSTNRGSSWSQVSSFPVTTATPTSGTGVVFVDFIANSGTSGTATPVIYVGVSDTGVSSTGYFSLYRSVDSGSTWQPITGQPTGYYPAHGVLGPDGNLYLSYGNQVGPAGITGGALYKYSLPPSASPGGAGSWTNITPPVAQRPSGTQGGFGGLALDPERPGVIMAATMDDYYPYGDDIYRSQNYGVTWVSLDQQGKVQNFSLSPWVAFGNSTTGTGNWPGTLVIDPFNSNHVLYGNGQTIWDSTNMNLSDAGSAPTFNIGAQGIEETVSHILMSPPSGPFLVSGVSDLGGFVHTSVTQTPAGGMMMNPILGVASGIDFAQNVPATMVRVGSGSSPWGAYSTNGGSSWTPFAAAAPGTTAGQGAVAIAADARVIVWAPSDTASVYYSTNNGTSWTASTGATAKAGIFADRINPLKFYIYSGTTLQISVDGGKTFTNTNTTLPSGGFLAVSFAAEGDLWLGTSSGLTHSTNSGSSFSSAGGGISAGYAVGFGKVASSGTYPTIFLVGNGSSGYGFYRSTTGGASWILMNGPANQYGYVNDIIGDPRIFGRVYLTTGGRGIIYGDSAY